MTYSNQEKSAIYRVIEERRDMRHFRSDPLVPSVLRKLLAAAQQAPSVGYMQPWRFIRITDPTLREKIQQLVRAEIEETGKYIDKKERFAKLKLEGLKDCAEVWVATLMEGREDYLLGRRTIPEMDLASLSCAIQNIWLAARAEEIGMGWVSFFEPNDLAELLKMPEGSYPAAILCLGYVDEFYAEPLLKTAGWDKPRSLDEILFENFWGNQSSLVRDEFTK